MTENEPLIRNISDTARWVAVYRAQETERRDAHFRDPYARRLAGERGEQIAKEIRVATKHSWSFVARTYLFDSFIADEVANGADVVMNLAAGLDTRPYRMPLPSALHWIEVDLPDMIAFKTKALAAEKPRCRLDRVSLDLADVSARRALFSQVGREARRVVIVSEGLILYLTAGEVGALATDLAGPPSFQRWAVDLASPGLLEMMQKQMAGPLNDAGVPFKFAPPEGPAFFTRYGWRPLAVRSMMKTAAKLKRLPLAMRPFAWLPESNGSQGSRPWSGTCLLARS
jgi:methyltransferase (TIGR00027 family)